MDLQDGVYEEDVIGAGCGGANGKEPEVCVLLLKVIFEHVLEEKKMPDVETNCVNQREE